MLSHIIYSLSFKKIYIVYLGQKRGGRAPPLNPPLITCRSVRLGYCFSPYQRLWLYNGAPLVAFYDTLGIRRTYSRLKPPASSRGSCRSVTQSSLYTSINLNKSQNIRRKVPKFDRSIGYMTDISYLIGIVRSYQPDSNFVRSTCPEYSVDREKGTQI